MNSPEIKQFIKENSSLFWYIREDAKDNIKPVFLVETILNYGDTQQIKKLFELIGLEEVARIFYRTTKNRKRNNYFPRTAHFFDLYFKRHARGNYS